MNAAAAAAIATDPLSYLIDFREHDVPYGVRASIDLDLRIGAWYKVGYVVVYLLHIVQYILLRSGSVPLEPNISIFSTLTYFIFTSFLTR